MPRSRWRALLALWVLGALLASTGALAQQEESCTPPRFTPQLLTPQSGRHPRDAALVVGLVPGGTFESLPPVMLTRRRREVSIVSDEIAPGLYRLRPDTRRIWGRYHVSGVAGDPEILFARSRASAAPTSPRLERVERYLVASADGQRTEVKAHFGFPIPQGVVAVVAYWGDDEDADLYARAIPTQREAVLFSQTGACSALPRGATPPPESGAVRVAFVDQLGQISSRSEPVQLGR